MGGQLGELQRRAYEDCRGLMMMAGQFIDGQEDGGGMTFRAVCRRCGLTLSRMAWGALKPVCVNCGRPIYKWRRQIKQVGLGRKS